MIVLKTILVCCGFFDEQVQEKEQVQENYRLIANKNIDKLILEYIIPENWKQLGCVNKYYKDIRRKKAINIYQDAKNSISYFNRDIYGEVRDHHCTEYRNIDVLHAIYKLKRIGEMLLANQLENQMRYTNQIISTISRSINPEDYCDSDDS